MNMNSKDIIIDPEFRDLAPPLSAQEKAVLADSLKTEGQRDPLLVWVQDNQAIVIDGHNRYWHLTNQESEEACSLPEIKTKEISFENREQAKEFIIQNQLGRRNLAPAPMAILRGKLYTDRKRDIPNPEGAGGKGKKIVKRHSDGQQTTAEMIAAKFGVSPRTVEREAEFFQAAEKLGITSAILSGKERRSRKQIIRDANPAADVAPAPPKPPSQAMEDQWKTPVKKVSEDEALNMQDKEAQGPQDNHPSEDSEGETESLEDNHPPKHSEGETESSSVCASPEGLEPPVEDKKNGHSEPAQTESPEVLIKSAPGLIGQPPRDTIVEWDQCLSTIQHKAKKQQRRPTRQECQVLEQIQLFLQRMLQISGDHGGKPKRP